jgi:hypothetical protein
VSFGYVSFTLTLFNSFRLRFTSFPIWVDTYSFSIILSPFPGHDFINPVSNSQFSHCYFAPPFHCTVLRMFKVLVIQSLVRGKQPPGIRSRLSPASPWRTHHLVAVHWLATPTMPKPPTMLPFAAIQCFTARRSGLLLIAMACTP